MLPAQGGSELDARRSGPRCQKSPGAPLIASLAGDFRFTHAYTIVARGCGARERLISTVPVPMAPSEAQYSHARSCRRPPIKETTFSADGCPRRDHTQQVGSISYGKCRPLAHQGESTASEGVSPTDDSLSSSPVTYSIVSRTTTCPRPRRWSMYPSSRHRWIADARN